MSAADRINARDAEVESEEFVALFIPTMMEFLKARIAEDEKKAQALLKRAQEVRAQLKDNPGLVLGRFIPGWHDWPDVEAMAAQALAECRTKRAIVALHNPCDDWSYGDPWTCPELANLAAIYEDHDDYDNRWAVQ